MGNGFGISGWWDMEGSGFTELALRNLGCAVK